ncbi:MAG TPA: alpha-L-arabinofuranosidase [Prolixibacteraceae bacterium]|jgi:hypothetical protein|nr:alpha-L-arabinofuranosidase [Prolixibacteraceae bacterium]
MKKPLLILIFLLSIYFLKAQNPQGFFLDNWQAKTATSPAYVDTTQPTGTATVSIAVDFSNKIAKVSKYVYGNNSVPWAGKMNTDDALVKNIQCLSPNILRCPGGSLSDSYFWDAVEGKGPTDIPSTIKVDVLNAGRNTANWAMTLDNYYDLLKKTNSTGCICVNYAYARYGTSADPVANAAHYAANWVRYDKGRTKYWEIGNENMGTWENGYKIDLTLNKDHQPEYISGELYGKHCRIFIDSMKTAAKQVGSEIKIGVVTVESAVTYDDITKNWNALMMPQIADKADFLIVHSYYTPYNENSTIATILNSASHTKTAKDFVLNALKTYGKKDTLPVALTEWNIFAVGGKQAVSYINGMHTALVLGELIKNQYGEATRWDLMNGWANGDDHGMFASSDEPGVKLRTPHAPFFYMYYFQKYFGDQMIGSKVTGSTNIVTYASSYSSGQSGIVIVNKGTTQQIVNVQMANSTTPKSYYRYVLTGGTDNGNFSRKVYVNGQGPSGEGGGPDNYATLKAMATRINGEIKFITPPLSVTYLLLTSDSLPTPTGITSIRKPSFSIFPNPAKDKIRIISPEFEYNTIVIMDTNGKRVYEQVLEKPTHESAQLNIRLNTGIYFLNISKGKKSLSKKFIAE